MDKLKEGLLWVGASASLMFFLIDWYMPKAKIIYGAYLVAFSMGVTIGGEMK